MKILHIHSNRHSHVKNQILRIFLLTCIIPVLVLGIISIAYIRKQMNEHYESLITADGIRVNSVLFDITTTIYNTSQTLIDNRQCTTIFGSDEISSSDILDLEALNASLESVFNTTAAVSSIHIYTNNPNIPEETYISSLTSYDGFEWYQKIGSRWNCWTELTVYNIIGDPHQEMSFVRRIGVSSSEYSAYLVIRLDSNNLRNRLEQSDHKICVSIDGDAIIYASDLSRLQEEMLFPADFTGAFYKYTGALSIDGSDYLTNYVTFRPYKTDNLIFIQIIDEEAYGIIRRMLSIFILIIMIELFVPGIIIVYFSNYFSGRVSTLKAAMHQASVGDYNIIDNFNGDDELSDTFTDLKSTVNMIHDKEAQFYQAKIKEQELINRQQQMEFEMLASQINPHFLYNTLETIRMQALSCGNRDVATSIKLLGRSMRYVLENTGTSFTTLTKELEYIRTYLAIQQLRFGDKVNYRIDVEDSLDTDGCRILPLLLQPIVENAILHGLVDRERDGLITISIHTGQTEDSKNDLYILIQDNGSGMSTAALDALLAHVQEHDTSDRQSIGLYNINQRIQLLYGENYYMHIKSQPGEGTTVTLKIPKTI